MDFHYQRRISCGLPRLFPVAAGSARITGSSGRTAPSPRPAAFLPLVLLVLLVLGTAGQAAGQSLVPEFLDGLRERGYLDTALEYLDQLEQGTGTSAEIREVLDLERGKTLQELGSGTRVPEDREQILIRAEEAFRRFAAAHANHSQAAFANSSLAELRLERAKSLIWQAEATADQQQQAALQQQARLMIDEAEGIYQKAHDAYKAQFRAFPTFIDELRDPEQYELRGQAESRYLRAWYYLTRCSYERGQTWPRGTDERREILIGASRLFEEIHSSWRTNTIGLHARLMMGKCFQEQDDPGRALGIYNEIISHESRDPSFLVLKSTALHYRLICLNDPQKQDHQVALNEASAWMQANRDQIGTVAGLGILWEKAIAEEKLAADGATDAGARSALLRAAHEDSRLVARYPGAFQEPARIMNRRVAAALGEKDREPRDFDTAFERARGMLSQIQKLEQEAAAAVTSDERQQKQTALDLHVNEIGRILRLALELQHDGTDRKAVAQARYLLSYVLERQRKHLDAVILSMDCMMRDRASDPDTAVNAAEVAMTAAVQAWNEASPEDRGFETGLLQDVCTRILRLYPNSARAGEARLRLGRVYQQLDNPREAAKWFLEIPESDPKFASARIAAGQSYWMAYASRVNTASGAGAAEVGDPENLQGLKSEAKQLLIQGIEIARGKVPPDTSPAEEVTAAEVTLASILILEGDFLQAISRLTQGGPQSVVSQTEAGDQPRPASGIRSRPFAELVYRLLLRAYVGSQQIDQALQTMNSLKAVGGQDVTAIYTALGKELQEELQRLKLAGEQARLAEVRSSFEKFLDKVNEQRDDTDYNSLVWIGETYYGLGQGVPDDVAGAAAYFEKAAGAFSLILDRQLAAEPMATAIRLRLARCRRQQRQFEPALALALEIITKQPVQLDAQFEAARILSDWGSSGQPQKLLDAIRGTEDDRKQLVIWGWSNIARRLQQSIAREPSPEFRDRFLEARYELSHSRRRYAATGAADATLQQQSALAEIAIFAQVFRDIDAVWWARFDRLYQDLQKDLGQTPRALQRPAAVVTVQPSADRRPAAAASASSGAVASSGAPGAVDPGTAAAVQPATAPAPDSGLVLPVLGLVLATGAGGAVFFLMSRPRRRSRSVVTGRTPETPPSFDQLVSPTTGVARATSRNTGTTARGVNRPKSVPASPASGAARPAARPSRPSPAVESGSSGGSDNVPGRRAPPPPADATSGGPAGPSAQPPRPRPTPPSGSTESAGSGRPVRPVSGRGDPPKDPPPENSRTARPRPDPPEKGS